MKNSLRAAAVALTVGLGFVGAAAPMAEAAPVPVQFRNETGTAGTMPQYVRLDPTDTTLTAFGSLWTTAGQPVGGQDVVVYVYTGGVRGAEIGTGRTGSGGEFRFDSRLPGGWNQDPAFNVQLAFDDRDPSDGVDYSSVAAVMKPVAQPADPSTAPESSSASPSIPAVPEESTVPSADPSSGASQSTYLPPTTDPSASSGTGITITVTASGVPVHKDSQGGLASTGR